MKNLEEACYYITVKGGYKYEGLYLYLDGSTRGARPRVGEDANPPEALPRLTFRLVQVFGEVAFLSEYGHLVPWDMVALAKLVEPAKG